MPRAKRVIGCSLLVLGGIIGLVSLFGVASLRPVEGAPAAAYVRVEQGDTLGEVLSDMEARGLIRSAVMLRLYSRFTRMDTELREGTYQVEASKGGPAVLRELLDGTAISSMVLIREGLWPGEVAALLEKADVAPKDDFLALLQSPEKFEESYGFKIAAGHMRGYIFPDTYELAPLLGAERSLQKMAKTFRLKVYERLGKPEPEVLQKWVIIGSMVELEAALTDERRKIAGVIYNRLRIGMPLQIDATIVYAKGKRGPITRSDYKLDSPHNTYLYRGLPPEPICSPGFASIQAAANPEEHSFLYYVAMPDRSHLFAATYDEHLRNIAKSRRAAAAN